MSGFFFCDRRKVNKLHLVLPIIEEPTGKEQFDDNIVLLFSFVFVILYELVEKLIKICNALFELNVFVMSEAEREQ